MTKVCHITTVHPSRYDQRIFEKECTSLAEAGYDMYFIINDQLPDEVKNNVKIISLHSPTKNRFDRMIRVANLAFKRALEIDADIYHLHDPELLRIALKLKNHGKKVIFDSHEMTGIQIRTKRYLPAALRNIIAACYKKYEDSVLNKIDGVVTPAMLYNQPDYFLNVRVPKVIVGNEPVLKLHNDILRDESIKKYGDRRLCYVGGINADRGAFHMVKAAALARRKILLVGDVSKDVREKFETMPEFEYAECAGRLPHEITLREIKKCAIGLSVLQNSGQYFNAGNLATKVFEYMALGLPVVMCNSPFNCEILKKYEFGLAVDPADDQAIADAVNKILDDPALYEHMAEEGRRAIENEMSWEAVADRLIEFYKGICESI